MGIKYKLFSPTGNEPQTCAFFLSEEGCRQGSKCKFLHVKPGGDKPQPTLASKQRQSGEKEPKKKKKKKLVPVNKEEIPSSDVSSESSVDSHPKQSQKKQNNTPSKQQKQQNINTNDDDMFFKGKTDFKRKPNSTSVVQAENIPENVHLPNSAKKLNSIEKRRLKRRKDKEDVAANAVSKKVKPSPTIMANESPLGPFASMPVQRQQQTPLANVGTFASMVAPPPMAVQQQTPSSTKSKSKKKKTNVSPSPLGTFTHVAGQQQPPITNMPVSNDFRNMNLPIAPFNPAPPNNQNNQFNTTSSSSSSSTSSSEEEEQIPQNNPEFQKWSSLIDQTRMHPKYLTQYANFHILKENTSSTPDEWIKAQPYNPSIHNNINTPQVIAIDCEMCRTQNPTTKTIDSGALCRISIVNGHNPSEVLLDSLVKPSWPIIDDVSFIHGITSQHLENVQFTLKHVQAFLLNLCHSQTIIVGHGLSNDLLSLRLEHTTLIDTSFLYNVKFENDPSIQNKLPSLKDLASMVLQKEMPNIHDSVNDAQVAFQCAEYYRVNQGNVPDIIRSSNRSRTDNSGREGGETLFVHRLPEKCTVEHILQLFQHHTNIVPTNVEPLYVKPGQTNGKTYVKFLTSEHANLAFDSLAGDAVKEICGKLQKRVYLQKGGHVCVRKMGVDEDENEVKV